MIKIKDNVDLKELEKYGFKAQYDRDTGEIYEFINPRAEISFIGYKTTKSIITIFPIHIKKKIEWHFEGDIHNFSEDVQDIMFDLIQAGLVEKVEKK